jgi:predicted ATP-dependent endonuclease of OLD family
MIEQIDIRNFQAHKKLTVTLDPGITTIIGPSDKGKSAIIRALRWVIFNRPGGDAFISHGEKKVRVTVTVDDTSISRSKKPPRNTYSINDQVMDAFGMDVPEDVSKVFNMTEQNFQEQHEAPYWFSETPGEVSRQLNQIVDLGVIDRVLGNLLSIVRKSKAEADLLADRLADAEEANGRLEYVPKLNKAFIKLQRTHKAAQDISVKAGVAHNLLEKVIEAGKVHKRSTRAAQEGAVVSRLGEDLYRQTRKRDRLSCILLDVKLYIRDIQGIPTMPRRLEELNTTILKVEGKRQTLRRILNEIEENTWDENELVAARNLLNRTTCPICGRKERQ